MNLDDHPVMLRDRIVGTLRLGRALRLVWRSAPGWTVGSLCLLVVQGVLPLAALYLMKLVVDAAAVAMTAADKETAFGQVALYVGLMGAVALVESAVRAGARLVNEAQSQVLTDYMYGLLHAKSVEVDLEYYESPQYYDKLHRAQAEAPFRPQRVLTALVQLGQNGLSLVALAGLLMAFQPVIALVLLIAALPEALSRAGYAGKMYRWQRQRTAVERQAYYLHRMLTDDVHAKEVRLFDLGTLLRQRFRDLRQRLRQERLRLLTSRSAAELASQAGAIVAIYGSYAFIAYRAMSGSITIGDLVMYFQAFQRGQGFLREMLNSLAGLYEDNLFLTNVYEFLDLQPKVVEPEHPRPVPRPIQEAIVFDHVSFRYPTGTRMALEDISLAIRPGEVVALVGENGSGKTTLVKLLCRLYDPTMGRISLDGRDLREFRTTALRRDISVIFQDYARYHLTARENIWFGDTSQPLDPGRVESAARLSGAHDVIVGLPQGYDTVLGKWFQDGEELSVGEWQRIALARAFLRDAQILVLDEPTSAMDARAEFAVFQKFRQLAQGRTAIIISHRFSTVRMADRIFVLDEGRITENGTHDELVRVGGIYAHLFELQAQYYR